MLVVLDEIVSAHVLVIGSTNSASNLGCVSSSLYQLPSRVVTFVKNA
jgi:hypothetical protein